MELQGKTALVTGASGFIGGRVARRLLAEGMRVRALVRRQVDLPGMDLYPGDVTDAAAVERAARGADLVVHCAASFSGDRAEAENVNIGGTENLVEAALRGGCRRFVYISTAGVYDPSDRTEIDEAAPAGNTGTVYGDTKYGGEEAARGAQMRGLPTVILRPPRVIGDGSTFWALGPAMRVLGGGARVIEGGGDIVSVVYVEDLVEAVVLSARKDQAAGQTYNVCESSLPDGDFWRRFFAMAGKEPVVVLATRPPRRRVFVSDRIRSELGWQPRVSYDEAMQRAERWLRENGHLA